MPGPSFFCAPEVNRSGGHDQLTAMRGSDPVELQRPEAREAYRCMDAIRFFAALAVVVEHARRMVWQPSAPGEPMAPWNWAFTQLTGFGHDAVMVFFVLSGFWITSSAVRRLDGERFWPEFLGDRLSRLLLVVVPALGLGVLLDVLGADLFQGAVYWGGLGLTGLADGVHNHLTPRVLAGNLLFLQGFAAPPAGTNGPLWSLGYEFWYYVWFAALAVSIRRRSPSLGLLALALGVIWPALLTLFPVWLMGSAIFYADRRAAQRAAMRRGRALAYLAAGVTAAGVVAVMFRLGLVPRLASDLLIGLSFSLALWGILRGAMAFPRWLAPFARYGAGASFSIYLTHVPLFAFVLSAIGRGTRSNPALPSLALIIALCLLAIAVGWLFSRLTEAHTDQIRQLMRPHLQPATRG
jgi:peptidoglycan/LPS O-acetylase OafA/YrhL